MKPNIGNFEYAARHQKARVLMEKNNLNALLITEPTNLFYFTGASYFGEMSFPRPAVLIIPCKEKSILITHDFHLPLDWDGDIREYPKVGEVPIEIVKKAFEEIGCTMGQVGAELGREQRLGMSYQDFLRVQDALPAISFVDAADIFWQLRMVKSETEITILTEACKIQDSIGSCHGKREKSSFTCPLGIADIKKYYVSLNLSSTGMICGRQFISESRRYEVDFRPCRPTFILQNRTQYCRGLNQKKGGLRQEFFDIYFLRCPDICTQPSNFIQTLKYKSKERRYP